MKATIVGTGWKLALLATLLATLMTSLSGCDLGGGDGGSGNNAPAATGAVGSVAARDAAANNTANNPNAAFSLVLDSGLSAVTVASPTVLNFAVIDANGRHVPGLTLYNKDGAAADPACSGGNVKVALAQLQADDSWRSLISNRQVVAASVNKDLSVTYGALDPVQTATLANPATVDATHPRLVGTLQENAAEGYYSYQVAVDVSNAKYESTANAASGTTVTTNGLAAVKDGKTVHRAALLLCYVDPVSKATVKVNPHIDFTLGADGKAVAVKDAAGQLVEAKKVVDREACNACHQNFAAHGGGRKDPQLCVMCHNPGSRDFHNDGQLIDLKFMVHKFHRGKTLTQDYAVHNSVARKTDPVTKTVYGITFPGELRRCSKCHDGSANAAVRTAQGDNWKTKPSKNACFACHDDYKVAGSKWQVAHLGAGVSVTDPDSNADSACARCHAPLSSAVNPAVMHTVPEWTLGGSYQYNIWSTTLNADRTVSVEYSVSNPQDGSEYDLLDHKNNSYELTNTAGTVKTKTFVFGGGVLYIGWGAGDYDNAGAIGRPWQSSCLTAGTPSSASTTACSAAGLPQANNPRALNATAPISNGYGGTLITRGQPVALNILFDPTVKRVGSGKHFTLTSTPLPETATGTGVVAFAGRVSVQKDANTSYAIPVRNVVSYFSLDGKAVQPRREVVATAKCEGCHDRFIKNHGHGGSRNVPEVCVICHNGNNPLNGTVVVAAPAPATGFVASGEWGDSAHLKRAVHMWHKEQTVNNKSTTTLLGQGNNFPAQYPLTAAYGDLGNCNMCHVNNSYQRDRSVIGTSRTYAVDLTAASTNAAITDTDATNNAAISPKAATCSACHSSDDEKKHMMNVGGATFGGPFGLGALQGDRLFTQQDIRNGKPAELCEGCHIAGGLAPVERMHNVK